MKIKKYYILKVYCENCGMIENRKFRYFDSINKYACNKCGCKKLISFNSVKMEKYKSHILISPPPAPSNKICGFF